MASQQDLPVSSPSLWTQPCTDQHLWRMSQLISDWREMAPALGLTITDEMNIVEYAPHSIPAQRVAMLRTWRRKLGTAATYSRLAHAFSVCGKQLQDLVDAITELVTTASAESVYNGSDHSEIHKESSRIVWHHIKQQGKLNSICSLKMLFCGPPETGKTTAMRRLTNQIRCLDPNSPAVDSTVLDKPRTVQLIHKSSVLIADHESWNFDESVKEQGHSIYSLIINSLHGSNTNADESDDAHDHTQTASEQDVMVEISIEEVTRLAQAEEWEEVAKKLSGIKDITILHVIDSGGQPECHEILPLLLDGQVLALIFLDLSKNLNNKHAVSFRSSNRYAAAHSEKFPPSEFTTQEVLHHILTSIMSLQSVDDGSCNSIALLVGTHLDKVSSMQVRGLDLKLQDAFKHFIDRGLLCSTDTGDDEEESYIATLNNMTDNQEDIDRLRKLILEVINDHFRKRQEQGIPTGWLLLHLLLRDKYQDQGWCSMADCIATAKLCGIKEEDVCEVLDAIHKNYGTLLFYPSVIDYVICDPNVIISPLKSVFEFVFACSIRTKRAIARSIRDTGEITEKQLMECFEASSRTHLPSSCLIALFRHRYILCEIIHSAGSQKIFFMPCLLKTDANAINHRERHLSSPAPILFVAWSQVYRCYNSPTPLGLFPAVAVDLSGTWNCTMCKVRFRNRIQFDVKDKESGATFTVELCKYATYIELCLERCPNTGKILTSLREQVLDSLQRVSAKYTHMKPIKWELGFYCPSSLEEGGNPHPAVLNKVGNSPIVDMTCCLCSLERVVDLDEQKHKCWLVKNDHSATTTARKMQKIQQDDKPAILALDDMKNKDGTSLCIIDTIAAHSNTNFGLHLLDDRNGHIVSTIKKDKNNDCREVTMEILKRWIDAGGSNCTYKFLMDCLRKIGLGGLAEDINSNLMQPAESSSN